MIIIAQKIRIATQRTAIGAPLRRNRNEAGERPAKLSGTPGTDLFVPKRSAIYKISVAGKRFLCAINRLAAETARYSGICPRAVSVEEMLSSLFVPQAAAAEWWLL
jgi:hypothetical protein